MLLASPKPKLKSVNGGASGALTNRVQSRWSKISWRAADGHRRPHLKLLHQQTFGEVCINCLLFLCIVFKMGKSLLHISMMTDNFPPSNWPPRRIDLTINISATNRNSSHHVDVQHLWWPRLTRQWYPRSKPPKGSTSMFDMSQAEEKMQQSTPRMCIVRAHEPTLRLFRLNPSTYKRRLQHLAEQIDGTGIEIEYWEWRSESSDNLCGYSCELFVCARNPGRADSCCVQSGTTTYSGLYVASAK